MSKSVQYLAPSFNKKFKDHSTSHVERYAQNIFPCFIINDSPSIDTSSIDIYNPIKP